MVGLGWQQVTSPVVLARNISFSTSALYAILSFDRLGVGQNSVFIYIIHIDIYIIYMAKSNLQWQFPIDSAPTNQEQENTIGFRSPVVDAQADVRGKMDELQKSVSDYFPMIKRGFSEEKEEGGPEVVSMGWKHDVASRKEREEALR